MTTTRRPSRTRKNRKEVDVVRDGEIVKELQCKPKMYHSEEPPESLTWDEAIRFQWTCATRDVNDEVKGCSVADCMDQNTQGGNEPSPPLFMKNECVWNGGV